MFRSVLFSPALSFSPSLYLLCLNLRSWTTGCSCMGFFSLRCCECIHCHSSSQWEEFLRGSFVHTLAAARRWGMTSSQTCSIHLWALLTTQWACDKPGRENPRRPPIRPSPKTTLRDCFVPHFLPVPGPPSQSRSEVHKNTSRNRDSETEHTSSICMPCAFKC